MGKPGLVLVSWAGGMFVELVFSWMSLDCFSEYMGALGFISWMPTYKSCIAPVTSISWGQVSGQPSPWMCSPRRSHLRVNRMPSSTARWLRWSPWNFPIMHCAHLKAPRASLKGVPNSGFDGVCDSGTCFCSLCLHLSHCRMAITIALTVLNVCKMGWMLGSAWNIALYMVIPQ